MYRATCFCLCTKVYHVTQYRMNSYICYIDSLLPIVQTMGIRNVFASSGVARKVFPSAMCLLTGRLVVMHARTTLWTPRVLTVCKQARSSDCSYHGSICWQRALRYAPLFPAQFVRFLKNHEEDIIKHITIYHTLSYDDITLNSFIRLIRENSANNRVVITRIICCGRRRNLV